MTPIDYLEIDGSENGISAAIKLNAVISAMNLGFGSSIIRGSAPLASILANPTPGHGDIWISLTSGVLSSGVTVAVYDGIQSDGTTFYNIGRIAGPMGPQGDTGPAGTDGTNGIDGTNGTDGTDGVGTVSTDAGNIATIGGDSGLFVDGTELMRKDQANTVAHPISGPSAVAPANYVTLGDATAGLALKVGSLSVSTMERLTQAEYDLIVTPDPATYYIIIG